MELYVYECNYTDTKFKRKTAVTTCTYVNICKYFHNPEVRRYTDFAFRLGASVLHNDHLKS